jgi:hypothetical protein
MRLRLLKGNTMRLLLRAPTHFLSLKLLKIKNFKSCGSGKRMMRLLDAQGSATPVKSKEILNFFKTKGLKCSGFGAKAGTEA